MNLTETKSVEELKEFILNIERNLFKKSIECYLEQGYALSLIKAQVKDFYEWVDRELPFDIRTANRRVLLYNTAKERKLIESQMTYLNSNLLEQLTVIWEEIKGTNKSELIKQKKITEIFIKEEKRVITRMHPDKEPFYVDKLKTPDRLNETIWKHKRESFDIEDGIEKTFNILRDWLSQFELWTKTILSLNNEELRNRKLFIEKKINEGRESLCLKP